MTLPSSQKSRDLSELHQLKLQHRQHTQLIRLLSLSNRFQTLYPDLLKFFKTILIQFNPSTTIKFDIAANSNAKLTVFDVTGKKIEELVNEKLKAGTYEFKLNASGYSSGIYFYRLETENYIESKRMVLLK